jgi:hypothetical protein
MDGGRMKGNFTVCALIRHEPRKQQIAFKRQFGIDCKK